METFMFQRDKKPRCKICGKSFIKEGDFWKGNCIHYKGKKVEW